MKNVNFECFEFWAPNQIKALEKIKGGVEPLSGGGGPTQRPTAPPPPPPSGN